MPASTKHIQTNLSRIEAAKHPQLVQMVKDSMREVKAQLKESGVKANEIHSVERWSAATWALVVARAAEAGLATELPGTRGQEARRAAKIANGQPVRRTKAQKMADDAARTAQLSAPESDADEVAGNEEEDVH
ncbi:hypothetical protein E3T54_15025 [Cryobacterium sp. Sr8]|uniref:hypothetical protein n=1 Tax=Cryobacterium sp. Sr8 TaxID=1259203 RepID=UPI001068E569|nr:hypothetical protein [Cryobacterium sp. Sr8]TFD74110.1 hypothetical protein E3T54_15025 [Cryobacterium sp. Sr8]